MLSCQKDLFTIDPEVHYLNCAYKAPLLKSSEKAALSALIKERSPEKLKPEDFFENAKLIKSEFSKLLSTSSKNVAIIPSTSYGLASVFKNINIDSGKHAYCIENEFPSDYLALHKWCNTHNAELRTISLDKGIEAQNQNLNQRIIENLNEDTALLVMSSVHWMNGEKFDLRAIGQRCNELDILFIVDGTQSVGAMPIDVEECQIDALICAAYKWLMGPYSTGLAYFHPKFHNGDPIEDSWINRKGSEDFSNLSNYGLEYTEGAGRYNMGQYSNFILLPMLKSALVQINEWSPQKIQEYCRELAKPIFHYLDEMGLPYSDPEDRAHHLLGIPLGTSIDKDRLRKKMAENKLFLSFRGDNIRVALHLFNTREDIECLISTLKACQIKK